MNKLPENIQSILESFNSSEKDYQGKYSDTHENLSLPLPIPVKEMYRELNDSKDFGKNLQKIVSEIITHTHKKKFG